MALRIVSLNCWGGRVYEPLMNYLREVDADVYCLQEVFNTSEPMPAWLRFMESQAEHLVRPNLFQEIAALLPEHRAMFFPAVRGYLHDRANVDFPIEYGLATYVHNVLPIIGEAVQFVFGEFRPRAWGEPPLPRNAHSVRIFDYRKDEPVTITHMHGLWQKEGKGDTPARIGQGLILASMVENMCKEGEKVIVCGDFNLLPESQTFDDLQMLGLHDLVVGRGYTDTRTSYYKKTPRFADYMLVSDAVEVRKFDVPASPEVSDHRPLVLDFN